MIYLTYEEDADFDWSGLYKAESMIYREFDKRSYGCQLCMKEKYGTFRYEFIFAPNWLTNQYTWIHDLLRKIPFMVVQTAFGPSLRFYCYNNWIERLYMKLGYRALRIAIKKTCDKYPQFRSNILDGLYEGFYD